MILTLTPTYGSSLNFKDSKVFSFYLNVNKYFPHTGEYNLTSKAYILDTTVSPDILDMDMMQEIYGDGVSRVTVKNIIKNHGISASSALSDIYEQTMLMSYEGYKGAKTYCTSSINVTSLMHLTNVKLSNVEFFDSWEFEDELRSLYLEAGISTDLHINLEVFFNQQRLKYFKEKYPLMKLFLTDAEKGRPSFSSFGRDTLRVVYPGMNKWREAGKPKPDFINKFEIKSENIITGLAKNTGQILINSRPVK